MASAADEILQRLGLKFEELHQEERDTLMGWMDALDNNQLTLQDVKQYVNSLKSSVETEIHKYQETPQTWLGILAFFIPIYGVIRKWYIDQHRMYLDARLRNLILLEALLSSPEKARQSLERALSAIARERSV